jgi:DNA topoisomerase-1
MGRVQGPTLAFLVEREAEIREFVPLPFWKVSGTFEKGGTKFTAGYSKDRVRTRAAAEEVRDDCRGKEGLVASVAKRLVQVAPPPAFSTGDLQREAFRAFGLTPSRTLQAAERLYLGALISYPRTSSQRIPPSIDCSAILRGLQRLGQYSKAAGGILGGNLSPAQGPKVDPAHPAIHPTGEVPRRPLNPSEASVFDLVVRRFLAAFGPPARRELVTVKVSVGKHLFMLDGGRTLHPGWMSSYGRYASSKDASVPAVAEGERLRVVRVESEERFEQGPQRYNQSSLLEKMERENIGTKATRADTISTLVERGYVEGGVMKATDLGLAVVEVMKEYAPAIVTTKLTREVEERLEEVEGGSREDADVVRETVREIAEHLAGLRANEDGVGRKIDAALASTAGASYVLGPCPECRRGQLGIVRSRKTRKRFVGCSNYSTGCRASAPLPQRGTIRATAKACPHCSWPVVHILGGRSPWKLCVNVRCPAKGGARRR